MSFPIRLGIIGAGNMTMKQHLPALVRLRDEGICIVQEICDINIDAARKAAKKYNIPRSTHTASELIKKNDIDAVCIFGPADVHYTYGLAALAAGKHLFVEKPPAKNTLQLQELWGAALSKNRIAAAGFNRRFQIGIKEITNRIPGTSIHTAEAIFHKPSAGVPALLGMRTWLGVSAIHALDTLCFVMGERPTALYSTSNGGTPEAPENFSALIQWDNRHAIFSANNSAGTRLERYSFHGYGSSYIIEETSLRIYHDGKQSEEINGQTDPSRGIYSEFKSFLESIRSGVQSIHSLNRILPALRLVELIEDGYQGKIDWSAFDEKRLIQNPSAQPIQKIIAPARAHNMSTDEDPAILVLNPSVLKKELPKLSEHCSIVYESDLGSLSEKVRKSVVAIITGGPNAVPAQVSHFEQLPSVSVLCVIGASAKRWGGHIAIDRGIRIINTADVYADAVAEFIVMQALIGVRKASLSHEIMRRGGWEFSIPHAVKTLKQYARRVANIPGISHLKPYFSFLQPIVSGTPAPVKATSRTLRGRTVGLIGFGEITKKTIPLFQTFGCTILVYSEYLDQETAQALGVRKASLDEILRADVVSLQRGLSERTMHSFGTREINTLRPGTIFINSARAGLVDTGALIARLKKGDVFACLDVYDIEPLPAHAELRKLSNVFLTSHLAASIRHVDGLLDTTVSTLISKLLAHLEGKDVLPITDGKHFANMT